MNDKRKRKIVFIKEQFCLFFVYSRYYGVPYACHHLLWWICFYIKFPYSYQISKKCILKKTTFWDKRLKNRYSDVLSSIEKDRHTHPLKEIDRIWFFWAQGKSQMPPLVKACYTQLTHFNKNVILITQNNFHEYINLDDIIFEKVKLGKIKWANFSDIVRNTLLSTYGGLWLDATVWVSGKIPFELISQNAYWTAAYSKIPTNKKAFFWSNMEWSWSSSIMYSRDKNFILFSFVSAMLKAIAEREKVWPHYVILDYLIYSAYRLYPEVRESMSKCMQWGNKRLDLATMMNEKFNERKYNELIKTDFCFKLSFRTAWQKYTPDGKLTFNGRILSGVIENKKTITE